MTFRIPRHWREEYEPEGSEFYDPNDDDRTFRLTVMNFEASSPKTLDHVRTGLDGLAEKFSGEVIDLGNGYFFGTHERHFEENDEPLTNRKWLLARMITDTEWHLASFTYTYPDSLKSDQQTLKDLAFLEEAVKSAKFYDIENPYRGQNMTADSRAYSPESP